VDSHHAGFAGEKDPGKPFLILEVHLRIPVGRGDWQMADVSRTEIGRRMYSLQKEKNVERVIEKIRKQMGPDWAHFSPEDQKVLRYVIGEVWVYKDRDIWEMVQYPRITVITLLDLISIGRRSLSQEIDIRNTVEEVTRLLLSGSGREA